jgi:RNA polymerase I-specific transcription initiation factor RRN6
MVNNTLRDLLYGHPGQLRYSHETKTWIFGRDFATVHELLQLGTFRPLLQGIGRLGGEPTVRQTAKSEEDRYGRSLSRSIALLIRAYPELAPAHPLLSVAHRVSEIVAAGVGKFDPAKGQLIAYGSVLSKELLHAGPSHVPLLAVPGGRCGEALRLARLQQQPHGWEWEDHCLEFFGPSEEVGWWAGKGAPILQVLFAELLDEETGASLLAVRLPGVTIILEACHEHWLMPSSGVGVDCTYAPSRVHVEPLFEVGPATCKSTGTHVDVAFNPWGHGQFAVVDDKGQWAVFGSPNIHSHARLRSHRLLHAGCIISSLWEEQLEEDEPFMEVDGWARILWAGSGSTILVCLRQQISTINMKSGTLADVKLPDTLGLSQSFHLDCLRCPLHPSWVFLLTTEQIIWIEVSALEDDTGMEPSKRAKVIHSTRHFRDQRDTTLYMKIIDDGGGV